MHGIFFIALLYTILRCTGTKDGILMIEGAADFLPEEIMVEALKLGEYVHGMHVQKVNRVVVEK
jgi:polyribonucleotide nucleotidyltransferase